MIGRIVYDTITKDPKVWDSNNVDVCRRLHEHIGHTNGDLYPLDATLNMQQISISYNC